MKTESEKSVSKCMDVNLAVIFAFLTYQFVSFASLQSNSNLIILIDMYLVSKKSTKSPLFLPLST